jgi:uncharacterized damage-inducible protein DinB
VATSEVVRAGVSDYFRTIQVRVHELTAPLSSDELWVRPYSYGNSIGNLILHLTGNLNYYIGARIAETGYVRHRDLEFTDTGKPKNNLLREFDSAIEVVIATIGKQSDTDWSAAYSAQGTKMQDRLSMFLNCAAHANHHVGQIVYLRRELLGWRSEASNRSTT